MLVRLHAVIEGYFPSQFRAYLGQEMVICKQQEGVFELVTYPLFTPPFATFYAYWYDFVKGVDTALSRLTTPLMLANMFAGQP